MYYETKPELRTQMYTECLIIVKMDYYILLYARVGTL
jgi:hypothetical protein